MLQMNVSAVCLLHWRQSFQLNAKRHLAVAFVSGIGLALGIPPALQVTVYWVYCTVACFVNL